MIKPGMGRRRYRIISKKIVFLFLKIFLVLASSVDPDKMLHYAAFHLGLHCLLKFLI